MRKPKVVLTPLDVAQAFDAYRDLRTKWPIDFLIEKGATEKSARRAIIGAVCRGEIERDGDPMRGRLTETGRKLLKSG